MFRKLEERHHPLDPSARRQAMSLGDLTGLTECGIHLTILKPGDISTVQHSHQFADEFIFVISGKATLTLDDRQVEISEGDFIGLPAKGPSHLVTNTGEADFTYLMGGNRPKFDVCDYPKLAKRVYLYYAGDRRSRDFVKVSDVDAR